jgi:ribosome-binding protein aMBF1 (putative translation factor)
MGECEKCGKMVDELFPCLYHDGEKLLLCSKCFDHEQARGDYEYERWKEEQAEREHDGEGEVGGND